MGVVSLFYRQGSQKEVGECSRQIAGCQNQSENRVILGLLSLGIHHFQIGVACLRESYAALVRKSHVGHYRGFFDILINYDI